MEEKIKELISSNLRKDTPDFRPGDTVKVYFKIKDIVIDEKKKTKEIKEKIQPFEGIVIARKHGKGISATFTVRKIVDGIGVEKIFPLHSPLIEKIEVIKRGKVRRAKLYYLRKAKGKKAKIKERKTEKTNNNERKTLENEQDSLENNEK